MRTSPRPLLQEGGDAAQAVAHYLLALERNPKHATAWYDLGIALRGPAAPPRAIRAYERAMSWTRTLADAHFNLSAAYEAAESAPRRCAA